MNAGFAGLLGRLRKRMSGIYASVTIWSERDGLFPLAKKVYNLFRRKD